MKTFNSCLLNCAEDKFLRVDEKYYSALHDGKFNLFRTDNNVNLSDILEEDYCLCPYADDVKYKGIPTGQSYVDEDGEIIDYQIVTKDNHPGRLKYTVNQDNILLSSLRLAKSPALNFTYDKLDEYVFSNGYYIFRVKTGWDKRFVLYLLRSKKLKTLLDENIYRGIGISSYRLEDLFKIEVKKLTIEEQQNALKYISPIEKQISNLKGNIKDIQGIVDEVFQKEFHFDYAKFYQLKEIKNFGYSLSAFSLNPDLRFSAKFHRPAGDFVMQELLKVTSKKFKHFLSESIILGASISPSDYDENGDCYYLSMATIKNWTFEKESAQTVSNNYYKANHEKTVKEGDILLARSGEGTIGKVALIESDDVQAVFADFTMRIRLKDYNPKFAYYYMRSAYFQYLVEIYKKGLGNNTNIFPIVVREFPLIDIPIVEQQRIVDEIQAEIDMQNEIKNQSAILRTEIDKIIESAAGVSEN